MPRTLHVEKAAIKLLAQRNHPTTEITMNPAVAFFHEHAGWCYAPGKETPERGRLRCAELLAKAEAWLEAQPGHTVEWVTEPHPDYSGIDHRGRLFGCIVTLPCS